MHAESEQISIPGEKAETLRPRLGLSPYGGEISCRFPEQESYARVERQFKAESVGEPAGDDS
jgi:hypothetical protein